MNRRDDIILLAGAAGGAVLILLVQGCDPSGQGTDTGNALTVEFAVRGDTTVPTARDLGSLESARMILNKLEYYSCDPSGEEEVEFTGRFEADLLSRTVLGTREVTYDAVCAVELEVEREGGQAIEDTIVVTGTTSGGAPFEFSTTMGFEMELESTDPAGFPLVDGRITRIDLVFDLDAWFAIDLDAGVPTDGVVLIDEENNVDLHARIEALILEDGALESEDEED